MAQYSYIQNMGQYVIYDNDKPMLTPRGNILQTSYERIVERLQSDLANHGSDYHTAASLLSWQATYIDSFCNMSRKMIKQILTDSFIHRSEDWTYHVAGNNKNLDELFGAWFDRNFEIGLWLDHCTNMQLTAVCCIGNAYGSINLAFVLAMLMEQTENGSRQQLWKKLADKIGFFVSDDLEDIQNVFQIFELYYGIHLEENGPIIKGIVSKLTMLDMKETSKAKFNVKSILGFTITEQLLSSRNFHQYNYGNIDEDEYIELYGLDIDDDDDLECSSEQLAEFIPETCWIKRYANESDSDKFYLFYISVNDSKISSYGLICETISYDEDDDTLRKYKKMRNIPDSIKKDLQMLIAGRMIPEDFSFIGKKIPDNFNATGLELRSAYRPAFTNLVCNTTDDCINCMFYSSYQKGFGRPEFVGNLRIEALDSLIYMLDQYTDEEYEDLIKEK